jgi:ribonucleoside-diphosphate reductase alpha chain
LQETPTCKKRFPEASWLRTAISKRCLERKGMNTQEVWQEIIAMKGSVQYLEGLTDEEKAVFRTAYEMNMREIVQQAADRQPFIDQAQSLNVFFQTPVSGKYMHEVHFLAWKLGVKTLYYLRSSAPIEADKISMKVEKRNLEQEECAVCQ